MVVPVSSITLGELQTYIKRQFGDESGVQIQDSDITRWANMAAVDIVTKNSVLEATASQAGTKGTRSYDVSSLLSNVVKIVDVSYGSKTLEPIDKSGIKKLLGQSLDGTGDPIYWYIWANQLNIWPVPTIDATITIDFVPQPQRVSSPGNLLPLPDIYYEPLCNIIMSKAYELDENDMKSATQRKMADGQLVEMTDVDKTMSGSFPIVRDDFEGGYYNNYNPYYGQY